MMLPWRPVGIDGGPEIGTSLTDAEAAKLRELTTGKRVLEIGSAYGFSAVTMALTAEHVTAVDPHCNLLPEVFPNQDRGPHAGRDSLAEMQANLKAYGVEDRVTIVQARSEDVLPWLREDEARFGLIFIDGDHSEAAVLHDARNALFLLEADGVLACHDYGEDSCPGVQAALDRV